MNEIEKVNILIADRRPIKLRLWQMVLTDLDVNIIGVQSGPEALLSLSRHEFAVVLLAVDMPVMDGFETAALIRQQGLAPSIPIIFMAESAEDLQYAAGYALDGIDCLETPLAPAILRRKVSFFVDLHRQRLKLLQQVKILERRAAQLSMLASEVAAIDLRERRELAQILHDNIQQLLVAARFRLIGHRSGPPEIQARIVAEVDGLMNEAIEASRSLAAELSPLILHDAGLVPALQWLARRMKKLHSLSVAVDESSPVELTAGYLRSFVFCVVRELLFNCLKHSGVTNVTISLARGPDQFVQVTVSDDGQGFDPLLVESAGLDTEQMGLLSIRERAATLNGEFHVTNAPGRGTTVVLKMPDASPSITEPQAPIPLPIPAAEVLMNQAPEPLPISASIRVLIVDDHQIICEGIHCILENQAGIEVVGEATSGLIAVEMMRALHPDVILMDISMPGMNGIEATRIITRENADVRIIGLSLHMEEDMAAVMLDAGACAYLSKSGSPEALISTIRQSVKHDTCRDPGDRYLLAHGSTRSAIHG